MRNYIGLEFAFDSSRNEEGRARLVQAEVLQQSESEEIDARAPPKSTI
jgi:hypothetical protein